MALGFGGGLEAAKLIIGLSVTSGPALKALGDVQAKMGQIGTAVKDSLGGPLQGAMDIFGQIGDAADGVRSVGGAINQVLGRMVMGAAQMETFAMQFRVLLGSAEAADARIADLYDYAATTPFEMPGIVEASRLLQTFTDGALASGDGLRMVGDVAAGTGRSIEDVAFKVGRMYDAFRSGTNIGESLMYLQEMGAISGESRRKIEALAEAVQKGSMSMEEAWAAATGEFSRFEGMTESLAQTTEGKLSTAIDAINMGLAKLGEKFLPMVKQGLDIVVVAMDAFNFVAEKAAEYWYVITPFVAAASRAFMGWARTAIMAKIATTGLAFSVKTLWKSILGPVTLIIMALELLEVAWNENFLGIRSIVEGVFKWLDDNFGWLIDILGTLTNMLGQAVDAIGRVASGTQASGAVMVGALKEIETVSQETGEVITDTYQYMGTSWIKVSDDVKASGAAIVKTAEYVRDNWVADEMAESARSMANAARQSLGAIPEEAAKARERLIAEMQLMTADAVAEALNQRKAVADAISGAMDTATAEGFATRGAKLAKQGIIDVKSQIEAVNDEIIRLRKGGVTKAEEAAIAELQVEKTKLKDQLAAARLNYDQRLADLTQYGDDNTRISRLKAAASTKALAEGLSSNDDLVRRNTLHTLGEIYRQIAQLQEDAGTYGYNTVSAYARGLLRARHLVVDAAGKVVEAPVGLLRASSPPGPESPLHKIDVWGFRTGEAWADGMKSGVKTLDLSSMPGPGDFNAPISAPTWAAGGARGAGESAMPPGGAPGTGLVVNFTFESAVPYTPAEQTELGRRVGPAVYEYLRSRGAV